MTPWLAGALALLLQTAPAPTHATPAPAAPLPSVADREMAGEAPCPADGAPLPEALAAWQVPADLTAATDEAGLAEAAIAPGDAVTLALARTPTVKYVLRPERPGGSVSHGGMVALTIAMAGRYRVALGNAAWIDLVRDGERLRSAEFGHGPACTGIRKMVDFDLEPGRYVLEIAGSGAAETGLLVARAG